MEQRDNMHNGKLYDPNDDSVMEEQMVCLDRLYDFNQTRPSEMDKRNAIMKEMMGDVGKDCYIEPPFHANWGGKHVHFGDGVYANFGLTCVDDTHIYVGSHTLFGPNVVLATAGHPMLPELRKHGIQYNMPIHIGENCWLGAGVIVVPGVTIGDNVVIGASSVVTKDIPSNSVAMGTPCRVVRQINDHDKEYYFKDKKIDWSEMQQFLD
ncbi:sugar O-acetyltransferase [Roseburia sp. AM51-8]|uniref:Acetyltransferase n=1 Tax=Roseburia lenta TaxID=2763061 RepID=A0ABR7GG04_9FIRM|nr:MULTISPECIES: sugar O-acetyltransferase [Roseburia]MBC5686378.1 sugar O-acetyltransferase [Roseburia lenta]RHQ00995.1 sugar O-acetyltransferase [Roseburia sp. AM51-8]